MLSEIICFSVSEKLKDKNVVISEIQIRTISPSMKDGLTFLVNLKPENKQTVNQTNKQIKATNQTKTLPLTKGNFSFSMRQHQCEVHLCQSWS